MKLTRKKLTESRLPIAFEDVSLEQFIGDPTVLKHCKRYIEKAEVALNDGVSLLLIGPPESGKTFFAALVLKTLMALDYSCRYYTIEELTNMAFDNTCNFTEKMTDHHFTVIDGIDDTVSNGNVRAFSFFLRIKKDNKLPMIMCSGHASTTLFQQRMMAGRKMFLDKYVKVLECAMPDSNESINYKKKVFGC